jgi:hypothetical protein
VTSDFFEQVKGEKGRLQLPFTTSLPPSIAGECFYNDDDIMERFPIVSTVRINMEVDTQSLFGLHVT